MEVTIWLHLMQPKKGYTKKYAVFATNYGSNDNEFVPINKDEFVRMPEGIAHFLEHKMFEEPEGNMLGAAGVEIWTFEAVEKGTTEIQMEYSQPWEGGLKAEWTYTMTVIVN